MIEQLIICQHNTAKGKNITQSLFEVSMHGKATIVFVQEPYVYFNSSIQSFTSLSHPNYHMILPKNNTSVKPRVVTYINKTSSFDISARTDLISDPDMQLFEFTSTVESFYIIHIYNEKSNVEGVNQTTFQRFLELDLYLDKPFLFLGDLNLHHPWWNPLISNPVSQATRLSNFLQHHKASLLVNSEVIEEFGGTFHRSNSKSISIIDLAFASNFKNISWNHWHYGESTGSDHEVIFFQARFPTPQNQNSCLPARFHLKKADWKAYRQNLKSSEERSRPLLQDAIQEKNHDLVAKLLQNIILEATQNAIPRSKPSKHSKAWWTDKLTCLRKEYHALKRKAKKSWLPEDIENARVSRNHYFRSISISKKEHWESFLAEAKDRSLFTAYNYSNPKFHQPSIIPTLVYKSPEGDQVIASSFADKCNALVQSLFPQNNPLPTDKNTGAENTALVDAEVLPDPFEDTIHSSSTFPKLRSNSLAVHISSVPQDLNQNSWPSLSISELYQSVPDKKTSPGKDSIDWIMIKHALDAIPQFFLTAYTFLFQCGKHPSVWKESIGIIIPKRNKPDYSVPKAYRPISLISCLSKLLERIFSQRISFLANIHPHILHPSQMGGRKQRSAVDAVLLLQNFVENSFTKNRVVSTVFLDIMGAFDRLQPSKLIDILQKKKLPACFISWVDSFLSHRKISLLFNGQLSHAYTVTGAPQGSPISPLLFLISISELFSNTPMSNALEVSYVDDICISYSSFSVAKNVRELQKYLHSFFSRADSLSIVFEKSKSELIHFSKGKKTFSNSLQIDDFSLDPKSTVKWLGIWLQNNLNFKYHVEKRVHLAQGAMQRLFQLSSKSKGLGFNALRQLYLSCVIPVLDYGSVLWYSKYGTEKLSNMYDRIQKQAIPRITGAYRSGPSKALEVEAALLPTRVRHYKLASFFAMRILKFQTHHPLYLTLSSKLTDELALPSENTDIGMLAFLEDKPSGQIQRIASILKPSSKLLNLEPLNAKWMPPWRTENISVSISCSDKAKAKEEHHALFNSIPSSFYIIYTDGSLVKDKGCGIGIAMYLPFTRELKCLSFFLGKNIGIADAETYAIYKALQYLISVRPNAQCYIFSDSQTALQRITTATNFHSFKIRSLSSKLEVKLHWCPGHQGIQGNELADNLARKGLDQVALSKDQFSSHSFLKEDIRKRITLAWNSDWTKQVLREEEGKKAVGLGRFYRISARQSTPMFKFKSIKLQKYSRGTQSSYFQARTGIGNTLAYLKLIGKVSSDICNFCHRKKQTMQHLLLHCPQFSADRKMAYEGLEPLNLQILFNTNVGREKLLRFLRDSKCLILVKNQNLI